MLAIQVMQQILKDARMRDAADQIRTEVLNLGDDLDRLRERVLKLQKHFGDVNEDVRQILISADKIEKRAGRIEELDFSKTDAPAETRASSSRTPPSCSRAAQAAGGGVDCARYRSGIAARTVDRAVLRPDDGCRGDDRQSESATTGFCMTESANTAP